MIDNFAERTKLLENISDMEINPSYVGNYYRARIYKYSVATNFR